MTPATPQHIAFIMDGNGRWAQRRGLGRLLGHKQGIETVRRITQECQNHGIPFVTFYAFSTENWKRPWEEVSGLFELMRGYFTKELNDIISKGLRIRFIGDRSPTGKLPADILALMAEVEEKTAHNTKITAVFAINYSGRDELLRASQSLAEKGITITEESIATALDTSGIPDPDLIIRTSGEQRISNFLLWQLAYAELYFSEVAWPDFSSTHLQAALSNYLNRQRRFGAVPAVSAA